MKDGKILVVGGYGKVGRVISENLSRSFKNRVIIAGRNFRKAKELADELNNAVIPIEFDLESFSAKDSRFKDVKLVIMCIDQNDTKFVEWCFKQGIHYIDVTANYEFLSLIENLNDDANFFGATAILSVGLAPGITNLLAKFCKLRVPDARFLDIFILLGMGEKHGDEAILWMIENINSDFSVMEKGKLKKVGSFMDKRQIVFPNESQERTVYRFNLSDQHVVPKTLRIDSVSTWICLDSSTITRLLYLFRRTGLSRLLNLKIFKYLILKILKISNYGSELFAVKVSAGVDYNKGYVYESSLFGIGEAQTTGLVAAKVAESLLTSSFPTGVFHIEELIDPLELFRELNGIEFSENLLKTVN